MDRVRKRCLKVQKQQRIKMQRLDENNAHQPKSAQPVDSQRAVKGNEMSERAKSSQCQSHAQRTDEGREDERHQEQTSEQTSAAKFKAKHLAPPAATKSAAPQAPPIRHQHRVEQTRAGERGP